MQTTRPLLRHSTAAAETTQEAASVPVRQRVAPEAPLGATERTAAEITAALQLKRQFMFVAPILAARIVYSARTPI